MCIAATATAPSVLTALAILFVGMALLGMGNGAIFQMAPQRFPDRMGIVTGIVGAAGGLGGFFLPTLFGVSKDATGGYTIALLLLAGIFAAGTIALLEAGITWSQRWPADAVRQSGVYAYRAMKRPEAAEDVA